MWTFNDLVESHVALLILGMFVGVCIANVHRVYVNRTHKHKADNYVPKDARVGEDKRLPRV